MVVVLKFVDFLCGGFDCDVGMWCVVEYLVDLVGVEGCCVVDLYLVGGCVGDCD